MRREVQTNNASMLILQADMSTMFMEAAHDVTFLQLQMKAMI
jgi:hypothetical protein